MKYSFFKDLKENIVGPMVNLEAYEDFFRSLDIVPGDISVQNIGKDAIGECILVSCTTTKGLLLNFFVGNFFVDGKYQDFLCGAYYIYNDKYYFLRNIGHDEAYNVRCTIDFYDTDKLNGLKDLLPKDKSYIEPKDFIKHDIQRTTTFSITLDENDAAMLDAKQEDLIQLISKTAHDIKVRTRTGDGDLPFII